MRPPVRTPYPGAAGNRRWPTAALAALVAGVLAGGAALALEEPNPRPGGRSLENMDMDLLQRNLLKIFVTERESAINTERLEEFKIASEAFGEIGKTTLRQPTAEELGDMQKRNKYIFHYLLIEKTNAVQVINITDRILGRAIRLDGDDPFIRSILEKQVPLIEIPSGSDLRQAAKQVSEVLGLPIKLELPELTNYTVWFSLENTTGEAIIKQLCSAHQMEWRIEGGTLYIHHPEAGDPMEGLEGGGDAGLDEEERKALEELEKNKNR